MSWNERREAVKSLIHDIRSQSLFSLASTHDYSAANLSYAKELYDAEAGAKKEKKNVSGYLVLS